MRRNGSLTMDIRLYGYWRSTASYRVRIALGLKKLEYDAVAIDLRADTQHRGNFRSINPQGLVPALQSGDKVLLQSQAILEWLEESYPEPPLLPAAADDRAIVRAMAAIICCDIHPLNNLRVLTSIRADLDGSEGQVSAWIARWIAAGFEALERHITVYSQGFAFGSSPTLADCCLVPQVYSAERFEVDLAPYPNLVRVADRCRELPAFISAEPANQAEASN